MAQPSRLFPCSLDRAPIAPRRSPVRVRLAPFQRLAGAGCSVVLPPLINNTSEIRQDSADVLLAALVVPKPPHATHHGIRRLIVFSWGHHDPADGFPLFVSRKIKEVVERVGIRRRRTTDPGPGRRAEQDATTGRDLDRRGRVAWRQEVDRGRAENLGEREQLADRNIATGTLFDLVDGRAVYVGLFGELALVPAAPLSKLAQTSAEHLGRRQK
jgi:hypothetical protein